MTPISMETIEKNTTKAHTMFWNRSKEMTTMTAVVTKMVCKV